MKCKTLLVVQSILIPLLFQPCFAKEQKWNSDLSKMMDGLEKELGPGNLPKEPSQPAQLPPEPEPKPQKISPTGPTPKIQATNQQKNNAVDPKKRAALISELLSLKDNYLGAIAQDGLTRWPDASMPVKVFIEQTSQAKGFRQEFSVLLKEAFESWANKSNDMVKLSFTPNEKEAQIVCRFTDDKTQLMSLLEGGNTVIVPDDDGILGVDMKILTLPPPNATSVSTNYMRRVCLHEAGHALGITGHSPNREDIMYSTVYPNDPSVLTAKDSNSLVELYKMNVASIAQLRLDQGKAIENIPDNFKNPQVNAVRLNNQAAVLIKAGQYKKAINKLILAHKLDPKNRAVSANLGGLYANFGSMAAMTFNFQGADTYYKKAIPLLENGSNKIALQQVLSNYAKVLKMLNQPNKAKQIEARLSKLAR